MDTALSAEQHQLSTARVDTGPGSAVIFYRKDKTPKTAMFCNFHVCPNPVAVKILADDSPLLARTELKGLLTAEGQRSFHITKTAFHIMRVVHFHSKGKITEAAAAQLIQKLIQADDSKDPQNIWHLAKPYGGLTKALHASADWDSWDRASPNIMYSLFKAKLMQNPEIAAAVVSQADKVFVEVVEDKPKSRSEVWGLTYHRGNDTAADPPTAHGKNLLGAIFKGLSKDPTVIAASLNKDQTLDKVSGRTDLDAAKCLEFYKPYFAALLSSLLDGRTAQTSDPNPFPDTSTIKKANPGKWKNVEWFV